MYHLPPKSVLLLTDYRLLTLIIPLNFYFYNNVRKKPQKRFLKCKHIGHANHFLIATDLTVKGIAKAAGYERSDSFSSRFRRIILIPNQPIDKSSDIIIQFCVKLP